MQQLQPVIFPLPDYSPLLQRGLIEESACASAPCTFARFANEELYLRLRAPVADRVCGVLGSLAPPDEQALRVLLLAHTLRREGARRVVPAAACRPKSPLTIFACAPLRERRLPSLSIKGLAGVFGAK